MPGFLNKRVHRISVKPGTVILGWNSHINFPSASFLLAHISSHVTNMNQSNLGFKKSTVTDFFFCGFICFAFHSTQKFDIRGDLFDRRRSFLFLSVMHFIFQLSLNENGKWSVFV